MIFRKLVYCFVLLSVSLRCLAQQEEVEELLIEQLNEELGENDDLSEFTEKLNYYMRHPLDLNKADRADLNDLVFLSPQQIENLIEHRNISGNFISIRELQGISGFDLQTIQRIQQFVTIREVTSLNDFSFHRLVDASEHMLMMRYGRVIESQAGYLIQDSSRSRYFGNPDRYAVRYRMNFENKIRVALNMEKDAGEPFFNEKQKYGFDFYSGHIVVNDISRNIKQVVVGDYGLQFGQGLVTWNGLSFGKGAWIGSAARQGMGLKPYSSMNENNFQRGISAKLVVNDFEITPFVSYNSLSGNLIENGSDKFITTINYSGLHRTPTELAYRDAIKQFVSGMNVTYRFKRFKAGVTYMHTSFNGQVTAGNNLREQFDFEGQSLDQIGVHYHYTYRNMYMYGETAYSAGGGFAANNGVIASLHPKVSAIVNYRNYQRNYHHFFAQSLSEASQVGNEKGLYGGIIYHPSRTLEWVNYADVFRFPWFRFRVDGPSGGTDFLSQVTYNWYKKGKVLLRYRHRIKQENLNLSDRNENLLADVIRNQIRSEFQYKLNQIWTVRTRGELTLFEKEKDEKSAGWIAYQDIFWKGWNNRLNINTRLAYFHTGSYNSRIYAYENDVLHASSFPMYYGKGIRTYLNLRWRMTKDLDIWGRYAVTKYTDQETVGSGLDLIEGNQKSDFKIQVRWQW
ncbi:helix-hairpin-helix domain-containing protein [Sphingobacterium olei]|uniref:Helix-hairpin-helix domain-containing protein n=1 Tax=Sphingobacterium olei TaxID=2571155 RepID=A0A4U0NA84_9SPHI|nr:helix-hairpin-helix domain-containing protein [Sphingobacterium olei]TJZ50821.1 helix-hairpin-helix domain-containing protein [Sphingobacterium olei]